MPIATEYFLRGERLFAYRTWDNKFWPCINHPHSGAQYHLIDGTGAINSQHPTFDSLELCLAFLASLAGPPKSPEQREAELREAGWE